MSVKTFNLICSFIVFIFYMVTWTILWPSREFSKDFFQAWPFFGVLLVISILWFVISMSFSCVDFNKKDRRNKKNEKFS